MIKYTHRNEAPLGSFQPFEINETEIVLTSVVLMHIESMDQVKLQLEIGWDKPVLWDMGELEIMLRKDAPNGNIVEWSLESCFSSAVTKLEHTRTGGAPVQIYYLTVKSPDSRARIVGPYSLKGIVQSS